MISKEIALEPIEDTRIPVGLRRRGGGEADEVGLRAAAAVQPRAGRRGGGCRVHDRPAWINCNWEYNGY